MRIDLSSGYFLAPGRVTITLVGRVSIGDNQVIMFGGG
jgi:hypothetical protein